MGRLNRILQMVTNLRFFKIGKSGLVLPDLTAPINAQLLNISVLLQSRRQISIIFTQ